MSDGFTFDGEISIEPPLNYSEILAAQTIALGQVRNGWDAKNAKPESVFEGFMPLKFSIEEDEEVTERGVLNVQRAVAMVPSHQSNGSLSYSWETLLRALMKNLPGHKWKGEVTALHEDAHEAYKLVVDGSEGTATCAVQVRGTAYITWDDGSGSTRISDLQ